MIEPTMQAPRAQTAAILAGGVALGAAVAAGVAWLGSSGAPDAGVTRSSIVLAAATVIVSGVPSVLPLFLSGVVGIARWGMLAFTGILAQPMVAAAVGFVFDKTRTLDREAFWIGCLSGVLVVQVAWSIRVLSAAQKAWEVGKPGRGPAGGGSAGDGSAGYGAGNSAPVGSGTVGSGTGTGGVGGVGGVGGQRNVTTFQPAGLVLLTEAV